MGLHTALNTWGRRDRATYLHSYLSLGYRGTVAIVATSAPSHSTGNIRGHALQQHGAYSDHNEGLSPYSDPNINVGRPEYISVIYKAVSRKLLNSEVCGNASGNGK